MAKRAHPRDVVITGLPRSGTSFLCHVLNTAENVAVINEPHEVFAILLTPPGWRRLLSFGTGDLARYYRRLRAQLLAGETVPNKVVQDTRHTTERVPWRATRLTDGDFLLATKNTLLYTCSLNAILASSFRVLALVRHPFGSIGSWLSFDPDDRDFGHLRRSFPPFYPRLRRKALSRTMQRAYIALSRQDDEEMSWMCHRWNFLTSVYLEQQERISIVRYEDLCVDPGTVLGPLFKDVKVPARTPGKGPRSYDFDGSVRKQLWARCSDNAIRLGYQLEE